MQDFLAAFVDNAVKDKKVVRSILDEIADFVKDQDQWLRTRTGQFKEALSQF